MTPHKWLREADPEVLLTYLVEQKVGVRKLTALSAKIYVLRSTKIPR